MRLLAFTDNHGEDQFLERIKDIVRYHKPDLVVCAGDFTFFGSGTDQELNKLNSLGVHLVLIHGNHENGNRVKQLCEKMQNITFVHGGMYTVNGVQFFGWGGHGFRSREPELESLEEEFADSFNNKTIVLSHAPPYGTTVDDIEDGWHVGNESLTELIMRRRPMLVLCGHIHEGFHQRDSMAGAMIINPGPDGEIIEVKND